MNPLAALWAQIMKMRGGAGGVAPMTDTAAAPTTGAVQSINTPASAMNPANAMAYAAGVDPNNPAPPPTPGTSPGIQALNTPTPTPQNAMAQAAGQAGMPTPGANNAAKLAQYATAMKALQGLTDQKRPEPPEGHSFRMSAAGGSGFGKSGGLAPSPVGPPAFAPPPPGPVTSTGTFLLSPAGKAAMQRLQALMQPGQMAA